METIKEEITMEQEWNWWGNTDLARDKLIKVLEWLNPDEAEKAKSKFIN